LLTALPHIRLHLTVVLKNNLVVEIKLFVRTTKIETYRKMEFVLLLFMDKKHGPLGENEERVVKAFETWSWRRIL
jgi:hypothetical protein